jgi:TonB family protein
MQGSFSKYFPSLLSLIFHGFLILLVYSASHHYNPDTTGLIELGFTDNPGGGGGGSVFIPEPEEKIGSKEKPTEEKIKEPQKSSPNEKTEAGNSISAGQSGTGTGGPGPGGSGSGTGKPGISLGIPLFSKPKEEIYLVAVDEMPEPIGGIEAIDSRIILPPQAKERNVMGTVFVLAFVDEYGTVRKTLLTKGIGHGCDEAAMNAVFRSRFKPGKQDGRNVKVQVQIPVAVR